MRRRTVVAVALVVPLAAIAGASCSSERPNDSSTLTVAAAFYPLAEAASRVGGSSVAVRNLTPPGVEPHDLELTPASIADIQEADVVLYIGEGFAPAVEQAVGDASGVVVDVLEGLPLERGPGETLARDPHVWLDPILYRRVVERVGSAFADARPQDASVFEANARAFGERLADLDGEYREGLSTCARRTIVTAHAAFGYLAARYGLTQLPIAGVSPDTEPSAGRLAELAALVRREGVTTVFTEELVSPEVARTLADETGVTTAVLNPLEGLTTEQVAAGDDYVDVMRSNLAALRQALGCAAG